MKSNILTLLLVAAAFSTNRPALAQETDDVYFVPKARAAEAVQSVLAADAAPLHVLNLEQGTDHSALMVRRTESGEAEAHEEFDDVYVVQQGTATLHFGGTIEGARTTAPGELRGGIIAGGSRRAIEPGDVVLVPADVPHQIELEPGVVFVYHVLKVRRGK